MGNNSSKRKERHRNKREIEFKNEQIKKELEKIEERLEFDSNRTKFKSPNLNRKIRNNATISKFAGLPIKRIKENGEKDNKEKKDFKIYDKRERITGTIIIDEQEVKKMSQWPYCSIGMLQFKDNGMDRLGTGTLIGPYDVLTAAHNVYNDSKKYMTEICFLTGFDGEIYEKEVEIEKIYVPDEYLNDPENSSEDYAVLKLKRSLEDYGYFGIYSLPYEKIFDKELSLYGYPIDKRECQSERHFEMWGCSGKLEENRDSVDISNSLLKYTDIKTSPGQSGSAIFFEEENGFYISGVHSFQVERIGSFGVQINEKRLINIKLWAGILAQVNKSELDLSSTRITLEGIKYLTKFDFYNLTMLNLNGNNLTAEGISEMKKCSFPNLKLLFLERNNLSIEGMNQLKQCCFPKIKLLYLSNNDIPDEGMNHLKQCSFSKLTHLNLSGNNINGIGVKNLKECFCNLTYLNLYRNIIRDEGIEIMKVSLLSNLNILCLEFNKITDEGMNHLKDCKFPNLSILYLSENEISDEGMNHLKDCKFPNLTKLNLYGNKITSEGIKHLMECSFPNLTYLNLYRNNITDEGLINFEKCQFTNLTHLNLGWNNISDEGLNYVIDFPFQNIIELNLSSNIKIERKYYAKLLLKSIFNNLKSLKL